jgi:hypothetical protein
MIVCGTKLHRIIAPKLILFGAITLLEQYPGFSPLYCTYFSYQTQEEEQQELSRINKSTVSSQQ